MTHHDHLRHSSFLGVALLAILATDASAMQSPDWAVGFVGPGTWSTVSQIACFDDGGGEKLYVCSVDPFLLSSSPTIRRFDGNVWEPYEEQVNGLVLASCVWNNGTGNALYLGGAFTSVAGVAAQRVVRFDGTSWTPLGAGLDGEVNALVAHDDGSGTALYAGGRFNYSGSTPTLNVARWNGSSWSGVGTLVGGVADLRVFDDGNGPALYASGDHLWDGFSGQGSIARWNGTSWTFLPAYSAGTTESTGLQVFDDGTGPALYAAHSVQSTGWQVGRWNGTAWTTVGSTFDLPVHALYAYAGAGGGLFAMGDFQHVGGAPVPVIARWNGSSWSALPSTLVSNTCLTRPSSMCTFDPIGGPPLLVFGGCFTSSSPALAANLAQWDGSRVSSIGLGQGVDGTIRSEVVFDDGSGEALYVAGDFTRAGSTAMTNVARWNGASFTPLPAPFNAPPNALAVLDDGSGPALYVAGRGVRRWTGSSWVALDAGLVPNSRVFSLCDWNDAGTRTLVAAVEEQFGAQYVMRWNGNAWALLGDLFLGRVLVLGVHDAGFGEELYAGGAFSSAGMALLAHVARWNGSAWEPLGSGIDQEVDDLVSFDDGSGPALYVGGLFATAGSVPAPGVARWRNGNWTALGAGLGTGARVSALCVHDDGIGGPALYAGGKFTSTLANGTARCVARWDGSAWNAVGTGLESEGASAKSLGSYRAPHAVRPSLHVGGFFSRAGGHAATNFSVYGADEDGRPICFGDGQQQSCPCGNSSAVGSGAGCLNSQGHGSVLRARGSASISADTFELVGASMPPSSNVLYFQGTHAVDSGVGAPFGAGLRCAGGTTVRLYATQNSSGASSVPNVTLPTPVSVRGMVPASGGVRVYQAWHRDALPICGSTSNLTNGVLVAWRP